MLVGTLGSGEHDRVCGFVFAINGEWQAITMKSGGAKKAIVENAITLDLAKSIVEKTCK